MDPILLLIIIFLLGCAIFSNLGCNKVEPYNMLTVDCLNKEGKCLPLKPRYHAEFDIYNRIVSVDTRPPCKRGSYSCYNIDCPLAFGEEIDCWRCDDIITEPEND